MSEPKIPGGYIILARRIIESEIWEKPPLYLKVWIYILSKAQHKKYKNLQRGQTIISIPELQEACSWKVGYRTERPTKKQIFGIIEWLRNPDGENNNNSMIETTKVTHGMLVEVRNYAVYQTPSNYEGNSEGNKKQRFPHEGNDEGNDEGNAKGTTKVTDSEPETPTGTRDREGDISNEGNNENHTKVTAKERRRERQGNNINKNDKNDKNDKNIKRDVVTDAGAILQSLEDANLLNAKTRASNATREIINEWIDELGFKEPEPIIRAAIKETVKNGGRSMSYTDSILWRWHKEGVTTEKQAEQMINERKENFSGTNKQGNKTGYGARQKTSGRSQGQRFGFDPAGPGQE